MHGPYGEDGPKEALAAGLSYSQLLDKIITLALEKN